MVNHIGRVNKLGGDGSGKAKGDLMILDGHRVIDGKLQKTDFFNFLHTDLSDYSHIKMTPKQALTFKNTIVRMKHGVSAMIPMLCSGNRCINKLCVFHETQTWPLAQPCLLETRLVQSLTQSYMEDLIVEPDSPTEMTLINKLVECDLIDYRANIGLSGATDEEAASLMSTTVVDNGTIMSETKNLHPLLDAKDKAHRIRMHILESMASTRREKYKKAAALKKSEDTDASTFLADLKTLFTDDSTTQKVTSFDKLKKDAEKVSKDLIFDADWRSDDE